MRQLLHLLPVILLIGIALPAHAGECRDAGTPPGGDVLRPARTKPATPSMYEWYLGIDGGLTYSLFRNGPISYQASNPYNAPIPLDVTVNEGNGLGFTIGGAADFPIGTSFGIVAKIAYLTRMGKFDQTTDLLVVHPDTRTGLTTVLKDQVDWTFSYIGFDVLGRIQLVENSLYILVGPSFGRLLKNSAVLTETIVRPDDIFYIEDPYVSSPTEHQYRVAKSTNEVGNFEKSRVDLKAGLGTWIPLSSDLFLTPEVTAAFPLTEMASAYKGAERQSAPYTRSNEKWNATTIVLTVGLRWRIK